MGYEIGFLLRAAAAIVVGGAFVIVPARAEMIQTVPAACSILSRAEVEQALNVPVTDVRTQVNTEALTLCSFAPGGGGRISLVVRHGAGRAWSDGEAERMSRSGKYRPVAGLGDRAFAYDFGEAGLALCIFHGDYYVQLAVFQAGSAARAYSATERLARIALDRLATPPDGNYVARVR